MVGQMSISKGTPPKRKCPPGPRFLDRRAKGNALVRLHVGLGGGGEGGGGKGKGGGGGRQDVNDDALRISVKKSECGVP